MMTRSIPATVAMLLLATAAHAQKFPVAPGKALAPEETARRMTVHEGFTASAVVGEPDVRQPIAINFDDRGRLWVAEMYSYPHWKPEGNDRLLIFEDTDGDGAWDKRKVFYDKINCVSGFAVGFGGVWVGANPHFYFIPDRDGDDVPDGEPQILLDGWGHEDMHELLNSFTWGPDGWLYGCQGTFTHSNVGKPGAPDSERVRLNGAVWRYHPTKRLFERFAEGTSNPWGVDFNDTGQAFITACVIPHLYHAIQGARYHRQAGQHFNPHTYADIQTIADHRHWGPGKWQMSRVKRAEDHDAGGGHAHCGAMIYLGDLFPAKYRNTLFMNNVHGNRMNNDLLSRKGSGFVGKHGRDFMLSKDQWFRGLSIRTGPDGAIYVSDWYDKLACHQQKPQDRSNGRVYRIAYGEPKPVRVDLAKLPSAELVKLQLHKSDWYVRRARRLLQERGPDAEVHRGLAKILAENPDETRKLRALWALHGTGGLTEELGLKQLESGHEYVRAWTIQLLAEDGKVSGAVLKRFETLGKSDASPVVRLYLAAALQRLPHASRWGVLEGLLSRSEDVDDPNLPLMYWYAVEPLVPGNVARAVALAAKSRIPVVRQFISRRAASR